MDGLDLYRRMTLARAFEVAQAHLWEQGRITGEMHLGTGEEAVAAAVTAHLREGDAVALDHRPTPVLAMLGVDLEALLREAMGDPGGVCGGAGGHMHLFSKPHLAASSGIVGAAGPTACGFALAAQQLRPGHLAVAFFGDGAANAGQILESLNLAVAWTLPVLFVCKDNGWAITTRSADVTGGDLVARAAAFGLDTKTVDGGDLAESYAAAGRAVAHVRSSGGPSFLHATVPRLDGHFLGDPLVRLSRTPTSDPETLRKVAGSALSSGGSGLLGRAATLGRMGSLMLEARRGGRSGRTDPLTRARRQLAREHGVALDRVRQESEATVARAVAAATGEAA